MNEFFLKVKDFVLKHKVPVIVGGAVILLAVVLLVMILVMMGGDDAPVKDPDPTKATESNRAEKVEFTVTVHNQLGLPLSDVSITVYHEETEELEAFERTDKNGSATFTAYENDYIAVLGDLPLGYAVQESYSLTRETAIVLSSGGGKIEDVEKKLSLGDPVPNFTLTTLDGEAYTLSEVIAEGKPVVLNFWFENCDPCKQEFPYIQEAYAQYQEDVILLVVNLTDSLEVIETFRQESGLDLPFAAVEDEALRAVWQTAMNIQSYPTTVVIDRFGYLSLTHTGTEPDAAIFAALFAYYSDEAYQHATFRSMDELITSVPGESEANPLVFKGQTGYELTVAPGKTVYCAFSNVSNQQLQIASPNVSVVYNGQTYEPVEGVVSLVVNTPDPFTPALVAITNSGAEQETFQIQLNYQPGSMEAPFELTMGTVDCQIEEGNEQGVFYAYTSTATGVLTVTVKSNTEGVTPDFFLTNLNSGVSVYSVDVTPDAAGVYTAALDVNAGDVIQFWASGIGENIFEYPAAELELEVSFSDAEGTIDFTVTVTDKNGSPIPGVSLTVSGNGLDMDVTTNADGVAAMTLMAGYYSVTPNIPLGYQAEASSFELSADAPDLAIRLEYVGTVPDDPSDPNGGEDVPTEPSAPTDPVDIPDDPTEPTQRPTAPTEPTQRPTAPTEPTQRPTAPTEPTQRPTEPQPTEPDPTEPPLPTYTPDPEVEGETRDNPLYHKGDSYTVTVKAGYTLYLVMQMDAQEMNMEISGGSFSLVINAPENSRAETLYSDNGRIAQSVSFCRGAGLPALYLDITNTTAQDQIYTVVLRSPEGTHDNPEVISLGSFDGKVKKNNEQGYYFVYEAAADGVLTITCTDCTDGVIYRLQIDKLSVSDTRSEFVTSDASNAVSMDVKAGERLLICFAALENDFGPYPKASFTLNASFE